MTAKEKFQNARRLAQTARTHLRPYSTPNPSATLRTALETRIREVMDRLIETGDPRFSFMPDTDAVLDELSDSIKKRLDRPLEDVEPFYYIACGAMTSCIKFVQDLEVSKIVAECESTT